ncbi:MAG: hypothetical protein R3Y08_03855 [Rikenellaceae bacterium]
MLTLAVLPLLAAAVSSVIHERRANNRKELRSHYLRMILMGEGAGERYLEDLSLLGGRQSKRVAVEVATALAPYIYRLDEEPLLHLNRMLHLSDFLLTEASSTRGKKRAQYLAYLSQLPCENVRLAQLNPFCCDSNRMVRFFAMVAKINIDKANFLHHVASYTSPLTPFELSHLISLLRQGSLVVAYQPMLNSLSVNLNLLGLALVREFGIESAEEHLFKIIERSENYTLRREALYTLAALERNLCRLPIVSFLRSMSRNESRRFIRFIAVVGYSQKVVDFFVTSHERNYFHSLINSYKIKIECS